MKVVDMHCDTIGELYYKQKQGEDISILENQLHIDLKKMEKGDYLLQNFALFVHMEREPQPFETAMKMVDTFYQEMEGQKELIGIVKSWKDIEENRKNGKLSAMLTLEEGGVCQGELAYLRDFYRLGARMMTLTWNFENELGFPNGVEGGLKKKGIEFVQEMERIGMIIDVSHLNDDGIWDVFHYTKKPFVASHSNARSLASHRRNLTDEMIKAFADRGGVIGINYYASFLKDEENGQRPTHGYFKDMIAHMKHMKQVGGIQCIGLGSDFDGIDTAVEMVDCSGMQQLADAMAREGFTTGEIEAIFHGNVLRLYRDILL